MMFTLCVRDTFSAAHRIEEYHGKCEDLHGHNFTVEAFFVGDKPEKDGMVIDFAILKGYLKKALSNVDHQNINDIPFFRNRAASSEYIALYIYETMRAMSSGEAVKLCEVRVWESGSAWVSYRE